MKGPKNITQIISLPRSRTAWLSVALTAGECFAFHDAVNPPNSPHMTESDYLHKLNWPWQKCVVDCSSALIVRPDLIEAADCPIIIVERDVDEAKESFIKHIGEEWKVNQIWPDIISGFDDLKKKFDKRIAMVVGFQELARNEVIEAMCVEIYREEPGLLFDWTRMDSLQNLNIQERKPTWAGE